MLGFSARTVEVRHGRVMDKLKVKSVGELVRVMFNICVHYSPTAAIPT